MATKLQRKRATLMSEILASLIASGEEDDLLAGVGANGLPDLERADQTLTSNEFPDASPESLAEDWPDEVRILFEEAADLVEQGELDTTEVTTYLQDVAATAWEQHGKDWEGAALDAYLEGLEDGYRDVEGSGSGFTTFLDEFVTNVYNARVPPRTAWGTFMSGKAQELSERLAAGWKQSADAVSQSIAITITNGLNQGLRASEIAANIRALSDSIPTHRAYALARTELTRSYAEGQLDAYSRKGVQEVTSNQEAELVTQGRNVCPDCAALAKLGPMPLAEARGKIPVHVNCKCKWRLTRGRGRGPVANENDPTANIFCKTGEGGGVDPSCGAGKSTAALATIQEIAAMKPKALKALADAVGYNHAGKSPAALRIRLQTMHEQGQLVPKGTLQTTSTSPTPSSTPPVTKTPSAPATHDTVLKTFKDLAKYNTVSIADLAERSGIPLNQVHGLINDLRRQGVLTTSQLESNNPRLLAAAIREGSDILAHVHLRVANESQGRDKINEALVAAVANVFCKTGQGGGIDPSCKAGTGQGQGQRQSEKANPTSIADQLKNSPHEQDRQRIVESLGARYREAADAVNSLEKLRQATKSGSKEEKDIEVQLKGARAKLDEVNKEAHALIKEAVAARNGGKQGLPVTEQEFGKPAGVSQDHSAHKEWGKSREFLNGLVAADPGGKALPTANSEASPSGRAFYNLEHALVVAPRYGAAQRVTHEYGHHVEFHMPGVREAALEFRAHRVKDEEGVNMAEKYPGKYKVGVEIGYKDEFGKVMGNEESAYYTGKKYDKENATEIVSMGLEMLHAKPMKFATKDPEYFNFMMGVLSGEHRKKGTVQ